MTATTPHIYQGYDLHNEYYATPCNTHHEQQRVQLLTINGNYAIKSRAACHACANLYGCNNPSKSIVRFKVSLNGKHEYRLSPHGNGAYSVERYNRGKDGLGWRWVGTLGRKPYTTATGALNAIKRNEFKEVA